MTEIEKAIKALQDLNKKQLEEDNTKVRKKGRKDKYKNYQIEIEGILI